MEPLPTEDNNTTETFETGAKISGKNVFVKDCPGFPMIDNCNFSLDMCVYLFLGMMDCSYKNIMLEWFNSY